MSYGTITLLTAYVKTNASEGKILVANDRTFRKVVSRSEATSFMKAGYTERTVEVAYSRHGEQASFNHMTESHWTVGSSVFPNYTNPLKAWMFPECTMTPDELISAGYQEVKK